MNKAQAAAKVALTIVDCEHPEAECPKLRIPSCRYALAYFKERDPSFEPKWRPAPKAPQPVEVVEEPERKQVEQELASMKGKLPVPDTRARAAGERHEVEGEAF